MGEKRLPLYLNKKELQEHIVKWSNDALYRRIKAGFPAIRDDSGSYLFPTQECLEWFKRREVKPE